MPEPSTETQTQDIELAHEAANLANEKFRNDPLLLESKLGTQILTDQETIVKLSKDALTGVENRKTWEEHTLSTLKQCLRLNDPHVYVVLGLLDIDSLKAINDTYGHKAGDAVLKEIGNRYIKSFRDTDAVGRTGGDEFAFSGLSVPRDKDGFMYEDPSKIKDHLITLHRKMCKEFIAIGPAQQIEVTQSWGAMIINRQQILDLMNNSGFNDKQSEFYPELLNRLYSKADTLMYLGKNATGNTVVTNID